MLYYFLIIVRIIICICVSEALSHPMRIQFDWWKKIDALLLAYTWTNHVKDKLILTIKSNSIYVHVTGNYCLHSFPVVSMVNDNILA